MPDSLTDQQRRAVVCRAASVVLASGAGCGKTHVLTRRYLSHLRDDGAEVGQVVAITFTDRAARQMRERIRREVVSHLRAADTDAEAERWAKNLRGLETAPVSTIHAFCGNLLRQHAVEAGLDPRFDVLQDVLAVNFESEALTACLQRLLIDDNTPGEDLRRLVVFYGWNPVIETVQHLMRSWDGPSWESWLALSDYDIVGTWMRYARGELLPAYIRFLTSSSYKINRLLTLLRQTPPRPGTKMAANVARLLDELPRLADATNFAATAEALVEAAKVGGEKAKAWPSEEAYEAAKEALADFRDEIKSLKLDDFAVTDEELPAAVAVGKRFLRVATAAAAAYREHKRHKGVVDFQDLLLLARDLLRDQPHIRERLQRRYRFLLIDELQDTDPVQMELVRLLCAEGLTGGKLFAVGDHAQAIYRFRGADVGLFQALRREVPAEGRLGLTRNFRSQPAILDFANALFRQHLHDYEPLVAHHAQINPGPCVEFLWSPRGAKESVTEGRIREANAIACRIAAMVGREALVTEDTPDGGRLRTVRPGDVVLLFRAMSNVALYEAALREHGLNYYLVGGRAFFAQQEIYDLLNLLRALENPQDAVSLAGMLRAPFCSLSDEALFVLGRHKDGLWAGLHDKDCFERLPDDQRGPAERARLHLDRWRRLKDRLPIARLLGAVFADSGYDAATQLEFLGDRKLANLWKLLDLARTFDRSGLFGLAEFIQRLGDLVKSQPREEQAATQPENADVVRLMSVHQAKGLEFPVVFVPDLAAVAGGAHTPATVWDARLGCVARPPADEDEPPFPAFGRELWKTQEKIAERHEDLRILYVACTRAEDYLVLSGALPEPFRPTNTWIRTLSVCFDLRTGAYLGDGPAPAVRVYKDLIEGKYSSNTRATADETLLRSAAKSSDVDPFPLRPAGRVIELTALEHYWQKADGFFDSCPLVAADIARQFDAEDGSDCNQWTDPGEKVPSRTDMRSHLAEARAVWENVEFLAEWPGDPTVLLRGVIDYLWQDARGSWHLLAWETASLHQAHRRCTLWAWAVQQQLGVQPKDAVLLAADGTRTRWTARQLSLARVRADVDTALSALARLCTDCTF